MSLDVSSYLFNIRRQSRSSLLSLRLAAAYLPNEVVQLLLVEHPLALALHLDYGQLRKDRIAHDTTSHATSLCVRGTTGSYTTGGQRHRCRGRSCLFGKLLGDGKLLRERLRLLRWVRVGVSCRLWLCCTHNTWWYARGRADCTLRCTLLGRLVWDGARLLRAPLVGEAESCLVRK